MLTMEFHLICICQAVIFSLRRARGRQVQFSVHGVSRGVVFIEVYTLNAFGEFNLHNWWKIFNGLFVFAKFIC